jgi:hypothetical protein
MCLILLSELNEVQIFIKVIITKFHGIRQTGALRYMRTDGHDETKRRLLQLSERALKIYSSQHFTCDIISIKYYHFVSVMHENHKFSALRSISSYGQSFFLVYFDKLSKKNKHEFRKKNIKHKIRGLIFYTNLSEILLILRRTRRYIIIHSYSSSSRSPDILFGI